jgi:hypothetical protein
VVRKVIGPRNEKIAGGWRNLHHGDLNDLYCSPYFGIIICLSICTCLNIRSVDTHPFLFVVFLLHFCVVKHFQAVC